MGVIQNSINQLFTIAAAGAYLTPEAKAKTKGIQEAQRSASQRQETLTMEQARLSSIFNPKDEGYATILKGKEVGRSTTIEAQHKGLKALEKQISSYEKLGGDPNEIAGYRSAVSTATEGMKQRSGWKDYEKNFIIPTQNAEVSLAVAQTKKANSKTTKPKTKGGKSNGTKPKSKQK